MSTKREALKELHSRGINVGEAFDPNDLFSPKTKGVLLRQASNGGVNCLSQSPEHTRENPLLLLKGKPNNEMCSGCKRICSPNDVGCPAFEAFDLDTGVSITFRDLPRTGDVDGKLLDLSGKL